MATPPDYKALALAALQESDIGAIRCMKAGLLFPSEWQTYVLALRAVAKSGSVLPNRPAYPVGT